MSDGIAIGIDLGTTNSVAATMVGKAAKVIEDSKGHSKVPSIVAFDKSGVKIGEAGKSVMLTDPSSTIYGVKRLLGRSYDSKPAVDARDRMAYKIEKAEDGTCQIRVGDRVLSPVDVSAMVLESIRKSAEEVMRTEVSQSVITVPAHFNNTQRQLTLEAAKKAGLPCERLLNEPTAAALAYGYKRDVNKTYCIFDLGGGTFDVTVLRLENRVYEVLATYGDTYLGGEDFDHLLVGMLRERFANDTGIDLFEDKDALQRVKFEAEKAKCELSFVEQSEVFVPHLAPGKDLRMKVTRDELETLVSELVFRSIQIVGATVTDAGLQIGDIDDVILVGGQTRMPMIRHGLVNLFEKEPIKGVHPDQVVAVGAAIQAARLDDPAFDTSVLIDVIPFAYGIEPEVGDYEAIFGKYEKVPATYRRTLEPVDEHANSVSFVLRHGNAKDPRDNEFIGQYVFKGIPDEGTQEERAVEVTFRLDANANLDVTGKNIADSSETFVTIRDFGGMLRAQLIDKQRRAEIAEANRSWFDKWFGWLFFWRKNKAR